MATDGMLPSRMPRSAISLLMCKIWHTCEILSMGLERMAASAAEVMFCDPSRRRRIWFFSVGASVGRFRHKPHIYIIAKFFRALSENGAFKAKRQPPRDHAFVIRLTP